MYSSLFFFFFKGEEIPAAAVREVFEETGVTASFESLLGFRHTHNSLFGRYFISLHFILFFVFLILFFKNIVVISILYVSYVQQRHNRSILILMRSANASGFR